MLKGPDLYWMKQGMPMPLDTRGLAFLNMFSLHTQVLILKEKVSSKPYEEADNQRDEMTYHQVPNCIVLDLKKKSFRNAWFFRCISLGLHWLSFCIGSSDLSDCCGGKKTQKMRRKKPKGEKKTRKVVRWRVWKLKSCLGISIGIS